jgi:hypothetical protein
MLVMTQLFAQGFDLLTGSCHGDVIIGRLRASASQSLSIIQPLERSGAIPMLFSNVPKLRWVAEA